MYCYQEACYKKWDSRFPNFLFLKEFFRKPLKLYRSLSVWCNENELSDTIDFLCGDKKIISCNIQKV